MSTFELQLLDSQGSVRFDAVRQFIGADDSGSFGLLAGHAPLVAVLRYGLARFMDSGGQWRYLSLPGGVLSFSGSILNVVTVRYFLGDDRDAICQQLIDAMAQSDSDISRARATMAEIEHSLVRRLSELGTPGLEGLNV